MVHPAAIPAAAVPGAEIVAELESGEGVVLCSLFRAALAWSNDPAGPVAELAEVEEHALARLDDGDCWPAAALIAAQLAGERVDRAKVAQACFCVADWALERNAGATALAFTLLAALVCPRHPRYAWAAGRMLRGHGRTREAEFWLERSQRVAVWMGDAYAQSISLSSLGMLAYTSGSLGRAERRLEEALLVATRHGMRVLEGEIFHNMMLLAQERHQFARAEEYATAVVERYLPSHERLVPLVHDIACLWMDQGYFARALPVLRSVLSRLDAPSDRFQAYAAAARASGGAGDHSQFIEAWKGAWECEVIVGSDHLKPAAFFDLGRGASSLHRWDEALRAFETALLVARTRNEADVQFKAEAAMEATKSERRVDERARTAPRHGAAADRIAREMIEALVPAFDAMDD
jgi:tetratricopeptide (TPR) repeat protein